MTATYFTGEPCRNGHVAPRSISSKRCVECIKEKGKRAYVKHGDKIRARTSAHYYANLEAAKQSRRDYFLKNRAEGLVYRREYYAANRDRLLAIKRERNATPEAKAARAAKRKETAHLYRGYEQKRRARLRGATPVWYGELDDFAFAQAAELCELRQVFTGFAWEIDHMVPLLATRASGLHWHANLQVVPQTLNRQKNRRMILTEPREWLRHV